MMRFYLCEVCEYFHSSFRHPHATLYLSHFNSQGELIMSTNLDIDLTATPAPVSVYGTLGNLYDGPNETGNIVTDPITSAVYSLSDSTLGTIASQNGTGSATITVENVNGTQTVTVTFTTASGASGTGTATITTTNATTAPTPGPAQSVEVNLSTTPPA